MFLQRRTAQTESYEAPEMPPRKRKGLMVQQSNKAPAWQKRISSFFAIPGSDFCCSDPEPSFVPARPDNANANNSEIPNAAAAPPSPQEKITHRDGPNRNQSPHASIASTGDPREPNSVHSTQGVAKVQRFVKAAELDSLRDIANPREHAAAQRENAADGYDSEGIGGPSKDDLSKKTFDSLLLECTRLSGEAKDGRRPSEHIRTSDTISIDTSNVPPWHLKPKAPKGHQLVENFITAMEEEYLLHCLDNDLYNPWRISRVNGVHMGKAFGVVSVRRSFTDRTQLPPMPKFVKPYVERMRSQVPALKDFCPNEMNAIDYRKAEGHWLKPHMDDRQLSGTILVNLSLAGTCIMTYAEERGTGDVYRVKLPRCSLQVVTGESRYSFTHGIQKDDFLSPRRVSMTFRQSTPLYKG